MEIIINKNRLLANTIYHNIVTNVQDYTALLSHSLSSPVELMNSRKYKTLLPTRIVPTRLQESYKQIMDKGKQVQAELYNKNTRVLPRLTQSQRVVIQLDPDWNIWTPAVILQCQTPTGRSYSLWTTHLEYTPETGDSLNQI